MESNDPKIEDNFSDFNIESQQENIEDGVWRPLGLKNYIVFKDKYNIILKSI